MTSFDSTTYKIFSNNAIANKYKKALEYKFIFNELEKTGLPLNFSSSIEIKAIYRKHQIISACCSTIPIIFFFSIKKLGFVNKAFFCFVTISGSLYNAKLSFYHNIIEAFIKQDNQIGHETRLLVKYKIPDHIHMSTIEMRIQEFKENINKSSNLLSSQNRLLNRIILEEEQSNALFEEEMKNKIINNKNK